MKNPQSKPTPAKQKRREAGLCLCGRTPTTGARCDECRRRDAEKKRRLKKERRAAGLCAVCGKAKTKDWRCETCQQKETEARHRREAKRTPEEAAAQLKADVEKNKKARHRRRQEGKCSRCGRRSKGYLCKECKKAHRPHRNAWHSGRVAKCIEAYGGRCACCGEANVAFLTIDHVNNDGAKHRKELHSRSIYWWLISHDFPPGFQVLCFNCNLGRHYRGGPDRICPHKRGQ